MEIFYTNDEPAEVTLYGTQSELCEIYKQIRKLIDVTELNEVQFDAKNTPSELKDYVLLTSLVIKKGNTPICVSVEDKTMVITSSQRWLGNLSSYFDFRETGDPGYHVNLDVHWGHESIHPDCIDTIIGIHSHNNSQGQR